MEYEINNTSEIIIRSHLGVIRKSVVLSYLENHRFSNQPNWLLMVLKRTSETKEDHNWGKQAIFLTFAQNRSIIISKALFISYSVQITIIVRFIDELILSLGCLCSDLQIKVFFLFLGLIKRAAYGDRAILAADLQNPSCGTLCIPK